MDTITVNSGGTVEFNGDGAKPQKDIEVRSGGTLKFGDLPTLGTGAAPVESITVRADGEMHVGHNAKVTIAEGEELSVFGKLTAPELELSNVKYAVLDDGAAGAPTLVITGDHENGSIIEATVVGTTPGVDSLTGTFQFFENGYIKDLSPKKFLTIESEDGGDLQYTGATGKTLIIGQGKIETTDTAFAITPIATGYVALAGVTIRVPRESGATFNFNGATLDKVIIDLTPFTPTGATSDASGKIIIEKGTKLILVRPGAGSSINDAGVITTNNDDTALNTGVAGGYPLHGKLDNATSAVTGTDDGTFGPGPNDIEIDPGDKFTGSGSSLALAP
jgi:hypothetical protein